MILPAQAELAAEEAKQVEQEAITGTPGEEEVEEIILGDNDQAELTQGKEGIEEDADEYIIPGDEDTVELAEGAEGNKKDAADEAAEMMVPEIFDKPPTQAELAAEEAKQALMQGGSIIAQTAQLVSSGAHIKDQVTSLRQAINTIKEQDAYKQVMLEQMHETIREINPTIPDRATAPGEGKSRPALDPDQKEAYRAIAKLDRLLKSVEVGNFGVITSMLKGRVKNHLQAMNTEPLKGQIERTISKASGKAETAEPPKPGKQ